MTRSFRHLLAIQDNSTSPPLEHVSSDFIIILAALLCALICFLGVLAMLRCRRCFNTSSSRHQEAPVNKGLKKKALNLLPTQSYSTEFVYAECVICLGEFADGDVMRVLPPCGHGFHIACIDTWLESNSSCPSCRHVLAVVGKCRKCGGVPSMTLQSVDVEAPASAAPYLP